MIIWATCYVVKRERTRASWTRWRVSQNCSLSDMISVAYGITLCRDVSFLCATKRLRLKVQLCQWHQINCFSPVNDRSQVERSACISLCKNDLRTIKSECIDQWCAFFSSYVFETWRRNVEYVFQTDHCLHHITWICFELPPFFNDNKSYHLSISSDSKQYEREIPRSNNFRNETWKHVQCQEYKITLTMSQSMFLRLVSCQSCQIHSWMIFMS